MTTRPLIAPLFAGLAVACADPVPDEPTWFDDVQPILVANCARCHGADPIDPQVRGFRLDRYVAGDTMTFDAFDYQQAIAVVAVDGSEPAMPPDFRLSARQREILDRWVLAGAPKGVRENRAPGAVAIFPEDSGLEVDQTIDLTLRTWDPDGDGLVVAVGAREVGASGLDLLAVGLGGGLRQTTLDTGLLASGRTFEIVAVVDDGFSDDPADNQTEVVILGDVAVDHGDRGTAPRVTLLSPNGGETLIVETTITWSATDPDPGDVLTIDLDLVEVGADGTETVVDSIASGLPNDPPGYRWDVSDVVTTGGDGQPIRYKVLVTATDAGARNRRSDISDAPFTVAEGGGTTDLGWLDVKPIFVQYCGECHGEPARNPALEYFRVDKYDAADPEPPANGDDGVFETRALIYQRAVVDGNMPPNSAPQLPAADLDAIAEWILAGAPRGGGGDGPPTLSWTTPNDSAVTLTDATGNVTLSWTAADPEGLALTGSIATVEISAPNDMLASCDSSLTGWVDLPGADIGAGSYAYTAPAEGYFCVRGQVTDQASQTTTAVAAKPIKYTTVGPP